MKHGRGYVYDLYYHIVWCVKYSYKILVNEIKDDFIEYIKNQGEEDAKRDKDKIISK